MRKGRILGVCLLLSMMLVVACAPKAAPAPTPQAAAIAPAAPSPGAAPAPVAKAPAKPAWQEEWDRVVVAAKQEGKVLFYNTSGVDLRTIMVKIANLQGLSAEVITVRVPEFLAKIQAERRVGLYFIDGYWGGYPASILTQGKPDGFFVPLDSALILPDFTNPERIKQVWYQGKFPWIDQNHALFVTSLQPGAPFAVNTTLVKPEEVSSYRALLDPKWRGKLLVSDPTIPGAAQNAFMAIDDLMGTAYLRELAATKPIITRDQYQQMEWLAQGKVAIVVAPQVDAVAIFQKIGAPVSIVIPREGTWLTASASGISMIKNAPHPNATKVFINLVASKEGQEIYGPAVNHHSLRLDVSTAHLRPEQMRQPGTKYSDAWSEESVLVRRPPSDKLAVEIFAPLLK